MLYLCQQFDLTISLIINIMSKKLLSILALLMIAAMGAIAQNTYTVTVREGTEDAEKWAADPNPAEAWQTVTVTYTGSKHVSSVTAWGFEPTTYTMGASIGGDDPWELVTGLPYETTLGAVYEAIMGSAPNAMLTVTNVTTDATNIEIGAIDGWNTKISVTGEVIDGVLNVTTNLGSVPVNIDVVKNEPIGIEQDLTPDETGKIWTLAGMPESDVEIEVVYYTQAEIDQMAADEVTTKINAIGEVEYTDDCKALIDAAREAYNALTDAQKALVSEETLKVLTDAEAAYAKANWFVDLTAGEYYIIDIESGLKMAAGNDWGTRGIVNKLGLDLTLTPDESTRTVTIDSRVYNGDKHFLGPDLYMDSSQWGWALEYQGFGFFILEPVSGKYINIDADNNLVLSDTPREFIIVTKDGMKYQLLYDIESATKENPVDATGLITAPNFNRNDSRNTEAWIVSDDCVNINLSGGNDVNNCAGSNGSTFTVMQIINDAPAGLYQLTAQGFYVQNAYEGDAPDAPMFFVNEFTSEIPARSGSESTMSDASESFTTGLYTIEPINFEVADDGMIYIGISTMTNTQWVIWDNFQLKYFGKNEETPTGIGSLKAGSENGEMFNLNGQRLSSKPAQKGIYIINGKKVVIK